MFCCLITLLFAPHSLGCLAIYRPISRPSSSTGCSTCSASCCPPGSTRSSFSSCAASLGHTPIAPPPLLLRFFGESLTRRRQQSQHSSSPCESSSRSYLLPISSRGLRPLAAMAIPAGNPPATEHPSLPPSLPRPAASSVPISSCDASAPSASRARPQPRLDYYGSCSPLYLSPSCMALPRTSTESTSPGWTQPLAWRWGRARRRGWAFPSPRLCWRTRFERRSAFSQHPAMCQAATFPVLTCPAVTCIRVACRSLTCLVHHPGKTMAHSSGSASSTSSCVARGEWAGVQPPYLPRAPHCVHI